MFFACVLIVLVPVCQQVPPVTNAAAPQVPGTTTGNAAQLPKSYGSHQGFPSKGQALFHFHRVGFGVFYF
jgi:hypothetical protein